MCEYSDGLHATVPLFSGAISSVLLWAARLFLSHQDSCVKIFTSNVVVLEGGTFVREN
jgi:hypothetical protein